MAISSVSVSPRYAFPSDVVSLHAVITVGNRCRFQLTAKPLLSNLDLYDASKANWLTSKGALDGEFTPDVDGVFTVTAVEETVIANPKHYSTHGSVGGSIGVETITTVGTQAVSVLVGAVLTRAIGITPDTMLITTHAHCAKHAGFAPSTYGVLTYYADQSRCAQLSEPTTDRARIAMQDATVATNLAAIGGSISATAYSGTSDAIDFTSVIDPTPLASIGWLISVFNQHVVPTPLECHHLTDVANTITAGAAVVGNLATLIALLDDLLATINAHMATFGGVHNDADTLYTMPWSALGGGASLAQAIARAAAMAPYVQGHFKYTIMALDTTAHVHHGAGDYLDPLITTIATDDTTACAVANDMATKYELHRLIDVVTAGYHAIAGGSDSLFQGDRPRTMAQLPAAVNELMAAFQDHCLNVEHTTGTPTVYHTELDYGGRTDDLPRAAAGDIQTALNLYEMLLPRIMAHFALGGSTHAVAVDVANSAWYRQNRGVGKITEAFQAAMQTASPTVPAGENNAVAWMTMIGGFKKA